MRTPCTRTPGQKNTQCWGGCETTQQPRWPDLRSCLQLLPFRQKCLQSCYCFPQVTNASGLGRLSHPGAQLLPGHQLRRVLCFNCHICCLEGCSLWNFLGDLSLRIACKCPSKRLWLVWKGYLHLSRLLSLQKKVQARSPGLGCSRGERWSGLHTCVHWAPPAGGCFLLLLASHILPWPRVTLLAEAEAPS